jgi:hypothetical protein
MSPTTEQSRATAIRPLHIYERHDGTVIVPTSSPRRSTAASPGVGVPTLRGPHAHRGHLPR